MCDRDKAIQSNWLSLSKDWWAIFAAGYLEFKQNISIYIIHIKEKCYMYFINKIVYCLIEGPARTMVKIHAIGWME